MLHLIDVEIIRWLNSFVGRSEVFDRMVVTTLPIELIKDVPLVAGLWWVWFSGSDEASRSKSRFIAFAGAVGVVAGCLVSRLVQNILPEHPRPLYTPDLHLTAPSTLPPGVMADYSSFPSDTSTLAFSLATVLWLRSRPVGAGAYLWALFMVSLPRVYVGFHYPLDLIGGALLGTGLVLLMVRSPLKIGLNRVLNRVVLALEQRYAGLFYAFLFLLTYQIGSVFEDARNLGRAFLTFLKIVHA